MTPRLIHAASESCADLFHATRFFAPDPFLWVRQADGTTHLVTSALEVDRARRQARVDRVHDWAEVARRHKSAHPDRPEAGEGELMGFLLRELGLEGIPLEVPAEFPLGLADRLREYGFPLLPVKGAFWPQRAIKEPDEVAAITTALELTGAGMAAGIEMIRAAEIGSDGLLYLEGEPLTSERVRGAINTTLVRLGAMPQHTIVAGGLQAADPHEMGHGPLAAHGAIILDVFPRVEGSGYFGDMTRTVCRGTPPPRLVKAWEAVAGAQEVAFGLIRDGASGAAVHQAVAEHLEGAGFPTAPTANGRQAGFFHGTGHGLGLEIHEAPRISRRDEILTTGHVVTVEPGLYYPDLGGVRLEDVVEVTAGGCRNLTTFPKYFVV